MGRPFRRRIMSAIQLKALLVALPISLFGVNAGAQVRYVDDTATGANNGLTWCDAYTRLQDALAQSGITEIRIAQGVYCPDRTAASPGGSGTRTATFTLKTGVAIRGGYAGCGAPDPNARDFNQSETILSGDLLGNDQFLTTEADCTAAAGTWYSTWCSKIAGNDENSYHVVNSAASTFSAVLDGCTITGGNANGSQLLAQGAGLFSAGGVQPTLMDVRIEKNRALREGGGMVTYGSPQLQRVTFAENHAGGLGGGGAHISVGAPRFSNCSFTANAAATVGGAVSNLNSAAVFTDGTTFMGNMAPDAGAAFEQASASSYIDCTFTGNTATATTSGKGGGMRITDHSNLTVERCTFQGNQAGLHGGAIQVTGSGPSIIDCEFSDNSARNGAGIQFLNPSNPPPSVSGCTFTHNNAVVLGGGIQSQSEVTLYVDRCRFVANQAIGGGAGVWVNNSYVRVSNSLFAHNSAHMSEGLGGGINLGATQSLVTNCTFYGNTAANGGGALGYSTARLVNSIFWENADATYGTADGGGQIVGNVLVNNCCIHNFSGVYWNGANNFGSNPMFVNPAGADGIPGNMDDNYRLSTNSSARDVGDNSVAIGPNDLDGNTRILGGTVDLGAYEALDSCGNGACTGSESPCSCPSDCGQPASIETACQDGKDNDCDGAADCADSNCPGCACGGAGQPPCPSGSFCKLAAGLCDPGAGGVCSTMPQSCAGSNPVCGCDGVTYATPCHADAAGVSIDFFAPCEAPACTATRALSDPDTTFCPGAQELVTISLVVPAQANALAVEDSPPTGWTVANISDGGFYDAGNNKVKWGPFFAPFPAVLSYEVMPSNETAQPKCFAGTLSIDGGVQSVCGVECLTPCCPTMAAEIAQACAACPVSDCSACSSGGCEDGQVSLCETISYACAWQRGCNDDITALTRAAYVWRSGECYCYDHGTQNWESSACAEGSSCCAGGVAAAPGAILGNSLAVGRIEQVSLNRGGRNEVWMVEIDLAPAEGAMATAVEIAIPRGWKAVSISAGGAVDGENGKIKWGPFFDGEARAVTAQLRRADFRETVKADRLSVDDSPVLFGSASVDGVTVPIRFGE
jgi:predicted outer membrane repeat protein